MKNRPSRLMRLPQLAALHSRDLAISRASAASAAPRHCLRSATTDLFAASVITSAGAISNIINGMSPRNARQRPANIAEPRRWAADAAQSAGSATTSVRTTDTRISAPGNMRRAAFCGTMTRSLAGICVQCQGKKMPKLNNSLEAEAALLELAKKYNAEHPLNTEEIKARWRAAYYG